MRLRIAAQHARALKSSCRCHCYCLSCTHVCARAGEKQLRSLVMYRRSKHIAMRVNAPLPAFAHAMHRSYAGSAQRRFSCIVCGGGHAHQRCCCAVTRLLATSPVSPVVCIAPGAVRSLLPASPCVASTTPACNTWRQMQPLDAHHAMHATGSLGIKDTGYSSKQLALRGSAKST